LKAPKAAISKYVHTYFGVIVNRQHYFPFDLQLAKNIYCSTCPAADSNDEALSTRLFFENPSRSS